MRQGKRPRLPREGMSQALGLAALLIVAAIALAGPSGLLAWSENGRVLAERRAEVARLTAERDRLRNRVDLLDPAQADPDLVGELLRNNLNVAHPDEVVLPRR